MPDPWDGKCGKMPHYCPVGGGGGRALLELTDALFKEPPFISYKKEKSLTDILVRAKL